MFRMWQRRSAFEIMAGVCPALVIAGMAIWNLSRAAAETTGKPGGTNRIGTVLPASREITDAAAGEKVRQRFAAQKTLEQADRTKAARLRVIRRTAIQMGDHRLIRNQVVPPALAPAAPSPIPPASGDTARWELPAAKPIRMLTLSATVYDRRITHLRWDHGGQNYTGWSSIDFNYLRGVTEFETADARYFVLMGLGDMTSQEFTAINRIMDEAGLNGYDPKQIPGVSVFASGQAGYFVEDCPPGELDPDALEPLDALHAFYEKNATQLQIDYRNTEKLHAARGRHEAAHPAPPRDEVLNFWMIPPAKPALEGSAPSLPSTTSSLPSPSTTPTPAQ